MSARLLLPLGLGAALTSCSTGTIELYEPDHAAASSSGTGGHGGAGGAGTGGATSSGTTSSTGSGGVCVPGTAAPCYDGPPGTEGVGLCKAGSKSCGADGLGYGPCLGETTPAPESCATPTDEDCDGLAPPCKGTPVWSRRFGDAADQYPQSVAVDHGGNVVVAGYFHGTADLGGGPLTSAGGADVFVAKLDSGGGHVWSKRFGDAADQIAASVAVDTSGNVIVTGGFSGVVDFGGGPLVSAGAGDVFVVKLDPDGAHLWSQRFGDSDSQAAVSVAVDLAGNVLVTGDVSGMIDFGGGPLVSAGLTDIFVAKLDPSGVHLWSQHFGDPFFQLAQGIAADASGDVLLTGSFESAIDFGGGLLTSAGGADVFVAKLDPAGAHLWSKRFGDAANQAGGSIAADVAGNVLVTGGLHGAADFGGGPLASAGGGDVFLVKLDPAGGHVWSKRFGDAAYQYGQGVAVDGAGNVLVTGELHGAADFGGGPLTSAGGGDVFLVKLDPAGGHVWSKRFGDSLDQSGQSVATDGAGDVLLTGSFYSAIDFGGGALTSAGGSDGFLAKFLP